MPPAADPDYSRGELLLWKNNDSAFYYFNNVVNNSKDSLLIAMSLNNMAVIQSSAGDYFGSLESLLASLQYTDEKRPRDRYCIMSDYNELGNVSLNLKNYDAAVAYYDKTLQLMEDEAYKAIALNNKAVVYRKQKKYSEAIDIYFAAIEQSKQDSLEYARVSSNLAITKWLQDHSYNAARALLTALEIREAKQDKEGLVASYMHLADYYTETQPAIALDYAQKLNVAAKNLNNADDELEALQRLIVLTPAAGSKVYFKRYQVLSDSVQTVRNTAKNQFALIRYEANKSKAENLRLQTENAERQLEVIQQRLLTMFLILVFGIVLFFIIQYNRKRKQQLLWQSQQAIQEQRLKTSQKIHDVVANGLYRIMSEVEYKDNINKDQLLDDIEVLYEQSRDISYEQPETDTGNFHELISGMLQSFASTTVQIFVVGNSETLWKNLNAPSKNELKQILQELMINMKKHSAAQSVVIKFERVQDILAIHYTDDGVGLPATFKYGNGLLSTENRIHKLDGTIIFDRKTAKGIKLIITVPATSIQHDKKNTYCRRS